MLGTYQEVSCSEWSGSDGKVLWNGSCLAGETAPLWPAAGGCPNTGANHSLARAVLQLLIDVYSRHPTRLIGFCRTGETRLFYNNERESCVMRKL